MSEKKILNNIKQASDIKGLDLSDLRILCQEARDALTKKLSDHGGHMGPNYGMVEMTTALHYVFNSPIDKIVYDVSHQTYVHKMLTGRAYGFLDSDRYDDITGYSNPGESDHDFFTLGHTSTSIALASGLAKARDLKGDKENIIAVIGDGSLSGGEALEGLNTVGELGTNMIIVVNDNEMSIAENHGGLYRNLKDLRESNGNYPNNLFKAMGLDYRYLGDGHDLEKLISLFNEVKDIDHPIVVHIHTIKGKGLKFAEENKEDWHYNMPFDTKTGKLKYEYDGEDYGDLTGQYLLDKMKKDDKLVVLTSGTPAVLGFYENRRKEAGRQFVDVGIAEEQAVAMASGIAKNGAKPVYGVVSTFLQRTYDQLSQDLCINNNPALIVVNNGTLFGMNDVTHLGFFDIPLLSNIPNLVYLAPTCLEEYMAMLEWGIDYTDHPVAIKIPGNGVLRSGNVDNTDYSDLNKYQMVKKGTRVAILGLGTFFQLGQELIEELAQNDIDATLINPKYITGIDKDLMESLEKDHDLVITIEDGVLDGGFGQKIASYYGPSSMRVKNYGIEKSFPDNYRVEDLLRENRLTKEQILEDIKTILA